MGAVTVADRAGVVIRVDPVPAARIIGEAVAVIVDAITFAAGAALARVGVKLIDQIGVVELDAVVEHGDDSARAERPCPRRHGANVG